MPSKSHVRAFRLQVKFEGVVGDEVREASSERIRTDRRRELSRQQRDPKRQRIVIAFIAFFVLVIAGVAFFFYAKTFVTPPRQVVIRVDDVEYTRGDMVKILRARQKEAEHVGVRFDTTTEILDSLKFLVENEMIHQVAPRFGITVSDEEIDASIRQLFPYLSQSGPSDPGGRLLEEQYRSYLNDIQYSREEHRKQIRKALLREKFRHFVGDSVPTVAEQVLLHRIIMAPEGEIDIMQVKLEDFIGGDLADPDRISEAFKQIVREFSKDDPETIRKGGDLGWVPRGIYKEYDDLIFNLEVGTLSGPIPLPERSGNIMYYLVSDREEAREVAPESRDTLKTRALQHWLNEERDNHDVYSEFNSEIYDWVVKELRLTTIITPTPPPSMPVP